MFPDLRAAACSAGRGAARRSPSIPYLPVGRELRPDRGAGGHGWGARSAFRSRHQRRRRPCRMGSPAVPINASDLHERINMALRHGRRRYRCEPDQLGSDWSNTDPRDSYQGRVRIRDSAKRRPENPQRNQAHQARMLLGDRRAGLAFYGNSDATTSASEWLHTCVIGG